MAIPCGAAVCWCLDMKRVMIYALALVLMVSMLFASGCGKDKTDSADKDNGAESTTATTTTTTEGTEGESTTATTTATAGESTTATTGSVTSAQTSSTTKKPTTTTPPSNIVTKPTKTGTTTVTPSDPTSAFIATFEEWILNLTEYKNATPKVVTTKEGTITSYSFTGAKNTSDYCVHVHSGADKSISAAYVTVKATEYDFMFPVLAYYVYDSLGLTKLDYDAFWEQFDAFPNSLELSHKSESGYRMSCVLPDEFLTFTFWGKSLSIATITVDKVSTHLQDSQCAGCYEDPNRALNYMTLTSNGAYLGLDTIMLDRALTNVGNRARLADVMQRAKNGEKITIGYIGGSVTEGAFASDYDKTSYAGLTFAWWEKTFPKAQFTYVNAGIGGTSSLFGVHRLQDDMLKYDPDFVIVEFGVNDCDHSKQIEAYSNLVHRLLNDKSAPAVMLLYVMGDSGNNNQENQAPVGLHYDLPMISYRDAIWPEVTAGNFTWGEIGADYVHPTNFGHALISELVIAYLTRTYEDLSSISTKAPSYATPYQPYVYGDAIYYHKGNIKPTASNGVREVSNTDTSWQGSSGSSVTFTFTGKRCILAIPTAHKDSLNVSVRIDGGTPVKVESYLFHGGKFANALVFDSDKVGEHTIEIICDGGTMNIGGLFVS